MLQYPVNVYPNNNDFDANESMPISFLFTGNSMIGMEVFIYDNLTGKALGGDGYIVYFWLTLPHNRFYNNDKITFDVNMYPDVFHNGQDYKYQIRVSHDKHDNVMMSIKTRAEHTEKNKVVIAKGNTDRFSKIWIPSYYNDVEFFSQYLYYGYEKQKIIDIIYDDENYPNCDVLVLEDDFSEIVPNGTTCKIVSNYITSPYYFFRCRDLPVVELSATEEVDGSLLCTATYSQKQGIPIKKYVYNLYKAIDDDETNSEFELIRTSGDVYSADLTYKIAEYLYSNTYKIELIVTNQNNTETTESLSFTPNLFTKELMGGVSLQYDDLNKIVKVTPFAKDGVGYAYCNIYREDTVDKSVRFVGQCVVNATIEDYLITSNHSYRYIAIPHDINGERGKEHFSDFIDIKFDTWTLTSLRNDKKEILNYRHYTAIKTWNIELDVQNQDIVNNLNRVTHIGLAQLPTVSMNDVNYITSGLSGLASYIRCSDNEIIDDIGNVEEWRKFITGKNPFLLKSPKGDVLFVHITDNPSTHYDDKTYLTNISFNYVETEKINNIVVNVIK